MVLIICRCEPGTNSSSIRTIRKPGQRKQRAKLWFIGGLVYIESNRDREQIEPLEKEAEKGLSDPHHSEVGWIRMPYRPRWFSDIQRNNWVIDCVLAGKRTHHVGSPARVICKRRYTTKGGRTYYMLMLERPVDREPMSMTAFKKCWRHVAPRGKQPPKRSQAITDKTLVDILLRLWTPRGSVSKRAGK